MLELEIALQTKQKEFRDAVEIYRIVGFGGARGGGKSVGLRSIHLIRRIQYPRSSGVIFRKTYPELESNHIRPLFSQFPALKEYWNEQKKTLTLPNGSVQMFRHCKNINEVGLSQGNEWHDFAYEEAGEIQEDVFDQLRASNRSSDPNIPARAQLTFNPGGLGHAWLKRRFITRQFKPNERPEDHFFIRSLLEDNPALMSADPEYENTLMSIGSEALRRAWRHGDWDVLAGQFFTEFQRDIHVIEPFKIPDHWNRFCAFDWGFTHPGSMGWFACDEDGTLYTYRERSQSGWYVEDWADYFKSQPDHKKVSIIWAGHDLWVSRATNRKQTPPTLAEEFLKCGLVMKRANIDRKQGAMMMRNYLKSAGKNGPRWQIFNTCPIVIDHVTRMVHNPDDLEDVLKVDASGDDVFSGDDSYDMARMGLMSRPLQSPRQRQRDPYATRYDDRPTANSWATA